MKTGPHPRRTRRGAVVRCCAPAGAALAAPGAAETPQDAYHIDMTCAALLRTGVPQQASAERLVPVAELFARSVQASGRAIGRTPADVDREVEAARAAALGRIVPAAGAKAATERADIAKAEEECAALLLFEIIGRHAPAAKS